MCGIAGIVADHRNLDQALKGMIASLHHRGPDNGSYKIYKNIGLAHTRLSIIDLSNSANQPMEDFEGLYSIVFNGEVYNYKELRKKLLARGCKFRNQSDTEVLLNGYILDGLDFFKQIRGFYALGIYDKKRHSLLLARDPYGKKPIFYSFLNKEFIFASEIKTILQQLNSNPDVNYEGLTHYLWKGYFANENSAYSGIHSLKAGTGISIDLDTLRITQSYKIQDTKINVSMRGQRRKIENVEKALSTAVNYRMVSDVPISFLLSGGTDSSLISYLAGQNSPIDTYYLGYGESDDLFEQLSIFVSNKINSNHHVHKMKPPPFGNALNKMIDLFDEPFADYSALPSYEIYEVISKKTKVAVSGDGADEIFCGYKDSRLFLLKSWLNFHLFQRRDTKRSDTIYNLLNSNNQIVRNFGNLLSLIILDEGLFSTTTFRGGWNHSYRRQYMIEEAYELTGADSTENSEIDDYLGSGNNILERYLNYELKKLTYDFLVKVDRTSMANSLEVRSPFLDTIMLQDINGTNYHSLVDLNQTKKELKTILQSVGLEKITNVPKQGFTPPLGSWILSESGILELKKMINSTFITSLFDKSKLSKMIATNNDITKNQGRLWNLMVLSTWHKRNYS